VVRSKTDAVIEANRVLHAFAPYLSFLYKNNRLSLLYHRPGRPSKTKCVQVAKHSGALSINYGRLGLGGTQAMAIGQLARFIRNQTRVPLHAWEHWTCDKIMLGGENSQDVLRAVRDSSYCDAEKTKCVICGGSRSGDWWSLDGVIGPCCPFGRCRRGQE